MNIITDSKIKDWIFENTNKFISDVDFNKNKNALIKEYLSELLDPEDMPEHDIEADGKEFHKIIDIEGEKFSVEATPSLALIGFYKFSFKLISSTHKSKPIMISGDEKKYIEDLNDYEYGLTNTGNPIKILKTLQSIMYRFIKTYNPRGISFKDYDEGNRGKVYSYMAKKITSKSGYYLLSANHYFFIFKDIDDMNTVKNDMGL